MDEQKQRTIITAERFFHLLEESNGNLEGREDIVEDDILISGYYNYAIKLGNLTFCGAFIIDKSATLEGFEMQNACFMSFPDISPEAILDGAFDDEWYQRNSEHCQSSSHDLYGEDDLTY